MNLFPNLKVFHLINLVIYADIPQMPIFSDKLEEFKYLENRQTTPRHGSKHTVLAIISNQMKKIEIDMTDDTLIIDCPSAYVIFSHVIGKTYVHGIRITCNELRILSNTRKAITVGIGFSINVKTKVHQTRYLWRYRLEELKEFQFNIPTGLNYVHFNIPFLEKISHPFIENLSPVKWKQSIKHLYLDPMEERNVSLEFRIIKNLKLLNSFPNLEGIYAHGMVWNEPTAFQKLKYLKVS